MHILFKVKSVQFYTQIHLKTEKNNKGQVRWSLSLQCLMFLGTEGRNEDYLLCVEFTDKKYTLKLVNPIFLPFLWGAFVLLVTTSGISLKDSRVTAALMQLQVSSPVSLPKQQDP